jgi:hypothetical protein
MGISTIRQLHPNHVVEQVLLNLSGKHLIAELNDPRSLALLIQHRNARHDTNLQGLITTI